MSWAEYDTFRISTVEALREDNLRLEALLRAKDETIGELLEIVESGCDYCYCSHVQRCLA